MEKKEPLPPCAFGCKQVSHKSGIYSDCPGIIEPDFLEGVKHGLISKEFGLVLSKVSNRFIWSHLCDSFSLRRM